MFGRGKAQGAATGKFSFIGPEVTVTGDIVTPGQLHIDGTVHGDVRCGSLSQSGSGAIHGNIVAGEARLAGLVDGAVEAGALSLEAQARVTGDVLYETLAVAAGAEVEGRFRRRRPGAEPAAPLAAPAGAGTRPQRRTPRPATPPTLFAAGEPEAEAAE